MEKDKRPHRRVAAISLDASLTRSPWTLLRPNLLRVFDAFPWQLGETRSYLLGWKHTMLGREKK